MEKNLDLTYSAEYDLVVDKDRNLSVSISCLYLSGCTEYNYDFTPWTGATLVVKNESGTIVQTFSTTDGSIEFVAPLNAGVFKLIKSDVEMNVPRAGNCYNYDMYLSNSTYAKRAFLRGKITYVQNIAN